jgi:hypothetical protein
LLALFFKQTLDIFAIKVLVVFAVLVAIDEAIVGGINQLLGTSSTSLELALAKDLLLLLGMHALTLGQMSSNGRVTSECLCDSTHAALAEFKRKLLAFAHFLLDLDFVKHSIGIHTIQLLLGTLCFISIYDG